MSRFAVAAVLALLPLLAPGASSDKIMIGSEQTLPGTGIQLRIFRDFLPEPVPLPAIVRIRLADHAKLIDGLYWWRYKQTAGIWSGPAGRIVIGEFRLKQFDGEPFATESELEKRYWAPEGEAGWSDRELLAWISIFLGREATGFGTEERGARCTMRQVRFAAEADSPVWLITPDGFPGRRVVIAYEIARGMSDENTREMIGRSLRTVTFLPAEQGTARKLQTGSSSEAPARPSAEYEASRQRVIDGIRNFRSWWYFETAHYIFVSNQEDRRGILRLRRDLEQARQNFNAYFPSELVAGSAGVVRIFNTRDEYLKYVGEELKWSGGLWSPAQRELVISPLDVNVTEIKQRQLIRQVAFHEGFHQYFYYAAGGSEPNIWFNEGAAQFFEGINPQNSRPVVELDKQMLQELRNTARQGRNLDLGKFIRLSREEFYRDAERAFHYSYAHLLMYYLLKGAPATGKSDYAAIPARYVEKLVETGDADAATQYAFDRINLNTLKADLLKFWDDDRQLRRAEKYEPRNSRRK